MRQMLFILFAVGLFCLAKCAVDQNVPQFIAQQTALSDNLLKNYRRELPPLYLRDRYENVSKLVNVGMVFTYGKLLTLNEPEQYVQVICESYVYWTDFRLQWNPANWSGIEVLLINRGLIWIPDVMPVDLIDYDEFGRSTVQNVVVFPDGSCTLFFSAIMKLLCKLNVWTSFSSSNNFQIKEFPFDTQTCSIVMNSANFITTEMNLTATVFDKLDLDQIGNGAWKAVGISMNTATFRNDFYGWDYPRVIFNMTMKRSPAYYIVMIVLPSLILTTLTVLAMFWTTINDFSYLKKLTLGFSAFLSQTLLLSLTSQSLPKTSHLPALSVFILLNLIILTSSIICVLMTAKYVRYLDNRPPIQNKSRLIIYWLKCIEMAHLFYMGIFLLIICVNLFVLLF